MWKAVHGGVKAVKGGCGFTAAEGGKKEEEKGSRCRVGWEKERKKRKKEKKCGPGW